MIVRRTDDEISIEGSREEMKVLSEAILEFFGSSETNFMFELVKNYDPTPYKEVLSRIKFSKSEINDVIVKDDELLISGTENFLKNISENLPSHAKTTPYHIHYDWMSFPQFLKADSLALVFEATS